MLVAECKEAKESASEIPSAPLIFLSFLEQGNKLSRIFTFSGPWTFPQLDFKDKKTSPSEIYGRQKRFSTPTNRLIFKIKFVGNWFMLINPKQGAISELTLRRPSRL